MSAEDFDNKVQGTTDDHRYHGVNGATRDFGMNQVPTRTDDGIHIHGTNLNKMVTMSPEMFEKVLHYLTEQSLSVLHLTVCLAIFDPKGA